METKKIKTLYQLAKNVQKRAYAPYSKFKVGAVLLSGNKVFYGCNVENASYGGTICAERVALTKAISEGVKKFDELVLIADSKKEIVPCGLCLQFLAEFCGPELRIWTSTSKKAPRHFYTLDELLPHAFTQKHL